MIMTNANGYEMKETIKWYANHARNFNLDRFTRDPSISLIVEQGEKAQLTDREMKAVLTRFPRNARARSLLRRIVWENPLWFSKLSLERGEAIPTLNVFDAISHTAIVPSYTSYETDANERALSADIHLYQIQAPMPREIRRAIHAEGLAHEIGHTLLASPLYDGMKLKLPDGRVVESEQFLEELGLKAENLIPVSNYALTVREGEFSGKPLPYKIKHGGKKYAMSEELAETIAQMAMPFPLHNPNRLSRAENLASRQEIVQGLELFLNAVRVK